MPAPPPARIDSALILHPDLLRRQALRNQLRRHGLTRIHEAEDAAAAAAVARQERLDVVFTPWRADGLEGPALFAALRARHPGAPPALVVLDEGLPQATVVAAVKAGARGRLPLPASADSVARVLEAVAAADPSGN